METRRKQLRFKPDDRKRAIEALTRYLNEALELDVGDLKSGLLLDFFLLELGPTIHNQALADARAFFQDRSDDLEGVCALQEFPRSSRGS